MISTVLLDGGGIIVDESDFERVQGKIIAEILSSIVPRYSIERYYSDIEEAVRAFCPNVYKFVIWKYSKQNRGIFEDLYLAYLRLWKQQRPPLRLSAGFAAEAIRISQNYKMVIAGQYGGEILDLLAKHSLLKCFAYHFTQDDFVITKPDPRYFEQIALKAQSNPGECIMVGDRIDKDVIPAKRLGMKTILIRSGLHRNQQPRTPDEIPDIELPDINGLANAIDKIAGMLA